MSKRYIVTTRFEIKAGNIEEGIEWLREEAERIAREGREEIKEVDMKVVGFKTLSKTKSKAVIEVEFEVKGKKRYWLITTTVIK